MKQIGILYLCISFSLYSMATDFFVEEEREYQIVGLSQDGFEINGRNVSEEENLEFEPERATALHLFVITPRLAISVIGEEVFVDEELFFNNSSDKRLLLVVHPKHYQRPALALKTESFVALLEGPHSLVISSLAQKYFERTTGGEPVFAHAPPPETTGGAPNESRITQDSEAIVEDLCKARPGATSLCQEFGIYGHFSVKCDAATSASGAIRKRCRAVITCANRGVASKRSPSGKTRAMAMHTASCTSTTGAESISAGFFNNGVAFVDCGAASDGARLITRLRCQ